MRAGKRWMVYTVLKQTRNRPSIGTPAQALEYVNQQLPKTIKSKCTIGAIKSGGVENDRAQ